MTHAVVLVEAERDALSSLGGKLADLDGVAEAYSVTGELVKLEGVVRTQTMVAFEVFSQHDLEALFSIGE